MSQFVVYNCLGLYLLVYIQRSEFTWTLSENALQELYVIVIIIIIKKSSFLLKLSILLVVVVVAVAVAVVIAVAVVVVVAVAAIVIVVAVVVVVVSSSSSVRQAKRQNLYLEVREVIPGSVQAQFGVELVIQTPGGARLVATHEGHGPEVGLDLAGGGLDVHFEACVHHAQLVPRGRQFHASSADVTLHARHQGDVLAHAQVDDDLTHDLVAFHLVADLGCHNAHATDGGRDPHADVKVVPVVQDDGAFGGHRLAWFPRELQSEGAVLDLQGFDENSRQHEIFQKAISHLRQ